MNIFLRLQRSLILLLLFCYPRQQRLSYGPEIYQVSKRLLEEAAEQGWGALLQTSLSESWGLIAGLIHERIIVWFGELLPVQRTILKAIAAYLFILLCIAMALQYASSADQQAITALRIGSYDNPQGTVAISGKRLDCSPSDKAAYSQRCSIAIVDKDLILYGKRNPSSSSNQLGGLCEAWYDQRQWECEIGTFNAVYWVAVLPQGLDLSAQQVAALRRAHPIENIGEQPMMQGIVLFLPIFTALLLGMLYGIFKWSASRQIGIVAIIKIALFCFIVWFFSCIGFGFLSADFWD